MEFRGVGWGCALFLLAVAALLVVGVVGLDRLAEWQEGRAAEVRAQAEAIYARANLVEAYAARDREGNLHREAMFQAWTVALAAFSSSNQGLLVVVAALLGAACAVLVVGWWERRTR